MNEILVDQLLISTIFNNARRRMGLVESEEEKLDVMLEAAKELDENKPSRTPDNDEAGEIMKLLGSAMTETESIEQVLDVLERAVHRVNEASVITS